MKRKKSDDLSERQKEILQILLTHPSRQTELSKQLGIKPTGLLHHLNKLLEKHYIKKIKIDGLGFVTINQIEIDPLARQEIRKKLGLESKDCTLITGFGTLNNAYQLPDESYKFASTEYYFTRTICFTSTEAKKIREDKNQSETLRPISKYFLYNYGDYRNINSKFFSDIEQIISAELQNSDIVIDLTPLTKLYSFKMLEIANTYKFPCFYLEEPEIGKKEIIWLTHLQLLGGVCKDKQPIS